MRRPSPSMVVATAALIFAATGVGIAAGPKIVTKDIRNGAVTSAKIRDRTITARDLRAGAVRTRQIKNRTIRVMDLHPSARSAARVGPQGPRGPKGDAGAQGPVGPSESYYRERETDLVLGFVTDVVSINVPAGSYVASATLTLAASAAATASCGILIGELLGGTGGSGLTTVSFPSPASASVQSQFAFTTATATTVRVACSALATVTVSTASLSVTRVGSLTLGPTL